MVSNADKRIQEILEASDHQLNQMRDEVVISDDEIRAKRRRDRFRGDDAARLASQSTRETSPPPTENKLNS